MEIQLLYLGIIGIIMILVGVITGIVEIINKRRRIRQSYSRYSKL